MKTKERKIFTPREIYEELKRFVIGQERAKKAVSVAAYNHYKRISLAPDRKNSIKKSNILLIGPTGCGKTHIARNLAKILDVPFTIADATEYTEAGYYGKDVEVMIGELLFSADKDVEATERGIIFIDEIDKIARRSHGAKTGAGSRDIGGEGVQQSLLKLLEGREVFVPLNVTQHWSKHDFVLVDTSNILFICAGTFSDIFMYSQEKRGIGFKREDSAKNQSDRRISEKELLEYGMIAEFLGRLPVVVEMNELTEEEMLEILTVPPDSLVREYQNLLSMDNVKVVFTDEVLRRIVALAKKRGTGARGLRMIMEELMADIMFRAPELSGESLEIDSRYFDEIFKEKPI